MKNLCFLPFEHFLYFRRVNENLRQSLVSKERLLDFALRANSGTKNSQQESDKDWTTFFYAL